MTRNELKAALVGTTIQRVEYFHVKDLHAFKNFDGKTAYKVVTDEVTMIFNEETLQALLDGITVGNGRFEYELERLTK